MGDFDFSGHADLRGLWDIRHQGEVKFEMRAERASLEKVLSGTAQRFGGNVVYDGHYRAGDFSRWARWQGKMEANLSLPELLTLKASGNQKDDSLTLDYNLEVNDLQKIAAFIPSWRGKGKVTSRGNIKGKWPDLVWEGVISSPLFQVGPVQGEQASLKGKGRIIGKEGQKELTLKVQNLIADGKKLGALNLDLQQEADTCRFNIKSEGVLNHGGARLSGRVEKIWGPVRTLLVNQSALTWKNQSASLDARIEGGSDGIRVQSLTMQHSKEKLQLAGEVGFDAKTDLKLSFEGINLGQWSQIIAPESQVTGTASGQIEIKGRNDQPEASIKVQLSGGMFSLPKSADRASDSSHQIKAVSHEPVIDRLQVQGVFARDMLSVQGDLESSSVQNPVHFSARIPMHLSLKPPQLQISRTEQWSFSGKMAGLQAASILPYLTFMETLGGRIDLDAQGGGTISEPLVTATGSWQNGSMIIKKWPNPVENIQVDWQADARQITIQKSAMELLGGHVEVTGRVSYPSFQEMDFEADGADLDVKDIYGIKGKASGHARLTAANTGSRLTGDLHLTKAEMNLGNLETDLARSIRVIDSGSKGEIIEVRKVCSIADSLRGFGSRPDQDQIYRHDDPEEAENDGYNHRQQCRARHVGASLLGQLDEPEILVGGQHADHNAQRNQAHADPKRPAGGVLVSGNMTGCGNFTEEQTEAGDNETEAHQSQAGSHPSQQRPLRCKANPRVLRLCRLVAHWTAAISGRRSAVIWLPWVATPSINTFTISSASSSLNLRSASVNNGPAK